MATTPNGPEKRLNFVPRVYDPESKQFRPLYIAPDATEQIQGDVFLSDAVDSELNAENGMTAASPKAVKSVQDNAETKVSKIATDPQTVASNLIIKGEVTSEEGFIGDLTGNVTGNADTASQLKTPREIKINNGNKSASAEFSGASNIEINLTQLDATTVRGVLPLNTIPSAALERVVTYNTLQDAIDAYNNAEGDKPFQVGDTVRVTGLTPNVMYSVIDNPTLESSYVEYAAGTSTNALHADDADHADKADVADLAKVAEKLTEETVGANDKFMYLDAGVATESNANIGDEDKYLYLKDGQFVVSTSTLGDNKTPVYINKGVISPIDHSIKTDVPENAVFTDTTYEVFTGATKEVDGTYGLVPQPLKEESEFFLRADGSWAEVRSGVTGAKGDREKDFRQGDVNLTYNDIGCVGLVLQSIEDANEPPIAEIQSLMEGGEEE